MTSDSRMETQDALDTDTLPFFSLSQEGTVVRKPKLKITVESTCRRKGGGGMDRTSAYCQV